MNIIVPTRNNHCGLSSLLGSILAQGCHHDKPDLYLMDGSDEPVITSPHLARLLTRFNLHYRHFLSPNVNVQRIHGITDFAASNGGSLPFLLVDDDHILVTNPQAAFGCYGNSKAKALFGICVDVLNDKGYPDYAYVSPDVRHHSFSGSYAIQAVECKELQEFSANPGLLITSADAALTPLTRLNVLHGECPAVVDDAWAKGLADPPMLHTALQAIHVGNNNKWWKGNAIKHKAVKLALEAQK